MTLKENAGKMAEETDQPGNEYIRKSLVSMTTMRIIKWSSFCFCFFWRFGLRGNQCTYERKYASDIVYDVDRDNKQKINSVCMFLQVYVEKV